MTRPVFIFALALLLGCSNVGDFERRTKLEVADSPEKVVSTDTHAFGEGEYRIVFKTTSKQIQMWLNGKPPWGNPRWTKGPIPHKLGIACQFNFPDRVAVAGPMEGSGSYSGDKDLERLYNDTTTYYAFRFDCCNATINRQYEAGALIILQPLTGMVYYSNWSY